MYNVGKCRLGIILKQKKMTQQELAEKTGLKLSRINRYVRNKSRMSFETAMNISIALGCSMKDLYEWIEDE